MKLKKESRKKGFKAQPEELADKNLWIKSICNICGTYCIVSKSWVPVFIIQFLFIYLFCLLFIYFYELLWKVFEYQ